MEEQGNNTGDSGHSRRASLEYLCELLPEVRKIAMGIDEPTLAHLLEMAMLEAQLQLELQIEAENDQRLEQEKLEEENVQQEQLQVGNPTTLSCIKNPKLAPSV